MIPVYVIGLTLGIGISIGMLMVDSEDLPPRQCLWRFFRRLLMSILWPIGGPVWLAVVCYKNDWQAL